MVTSVPPATEAFFPVPRRVETLLTVGVALAFIWNTGLSGDETSTPPIRISSLNALSDDVYEASILQVTVEEVTVRTSHPILVLEELLTSTRITVVSFESKPNPRPSRVSTVPPARDPSAGETGVESASEATKANETSLLDEVAYPSGSTRTLTRAEAGDADTGTTQESDVVVLPFAALEDSVF